MGITTTSILPPAVQAYFDQAILSSEDPRTIHSKFADKRSMPQNSSNKLRMARFNDYTVDTVALGNTGIEPAPQELTDIYIDAELDWYGMYAKINEQVVLTHQCPILNQHALKASKWLRQTEDRLMRDRLKSSAASINCTEGTNGDSPTQLTVADVSVVTKALLNSAANYVEDMIEGTNKFGTAPVRSTFFALGHTNLSSELDNISAFKAVSDYSVPSSDSSEWGAINNLRFFISPLGSYDKNASMNNADVYNIFCGGTESYASVMLDGYNAKFILRDPMYDGPLALNYSAGVKFCTGNAILNNAWIVKLRCTLAS